MDTVDVGVEVSVAAVDVVDVTSNMSTTIMFLVVAVVVVVADSTDVVDAFRDQDPGLSDILRG